MTQQDMPSQEELDQFESLVVYLKRTRGFDFSGYKSPSLMRRILKRMEIIKIASMKDYTDYLEVHPEEFALLFNHLLINVTSFFAIRLHGIFSTRGSAQAHQVARGRLDSNLERRLRLRSGTV